MITVAEALKLVLAEVKDFGTEEVDLLQSTGRILAEDIFADRDYPPFNRVTMDGISINANTFFEGTRQFKIEAIQAAGQARLALTGSQYCIEVMTGAMLPQGTDTVIPYELCEIVEGIATIKTDEVKVFQNIHAQGIDGKKGDILIAKDIMTTPAVVGLLASAGYAKVQVYILPKVAVCATGDELVAVEQLPLPYQIRQSNSYMLTSALQSEKIIAQQYHLPDDPVQLKEQLGTIANYYDVVLLSGAVSKGKFDYLPAVLKELDFEAKFHGIAQRPGKPFLFGKMPNGVLMFGFPGNPVSTFVCYQLYFSNWFRASLKQPSITSSAFLSRPHSFKPNLTLHLLVKLSTEQGRLIAEPVETSTSGDMVSLSKADGILSLPQGRDEFGIDEAFPLQMI